MERGSAFFGTDADDTLCDLEKIGGVSEFWEVQRLWEELDSVCVPIGRIGWNISVVITVVVWVGSNVPAVNGVG